MDDYYYDCHSLIPNHCDIIFINIIIDINVISAIVSAVTIVHNQMCHLESLSQSHYLVFMNLFYLSLFEGWNESCHLDRCIPGWCYGAGPNCRAYCWHEGG